MVSDQPTKLDEVFHALADPTRRAMLRALAGGERNLSELAAPFANDMSFPAVSKHVRVLEAAGLVRRQVQGRTHRFRLEPAPLAAAGDWLRFYEQMWNKQLDSLEAFFKDQGNNSRRSRKV